ncbi:YaaC family protein [Cytobacillus gottheilii]|uniref:YaaC family protein n=1 Tax=Cytobacillus gottheilii TaxID=859144 RepID=A0ABX8FBN6_9BACI|nr:YaaC family protein [Cytobacillus gottheilii]QVY61609.1 YaaC family protein [Cytobacillus gottheilii]
MSNILEGWESFVSFYSASHVQAYLRKCYQKQGFDQPEQKSFENCYPFIYYIEHGQIYYEQSEAAPLLIKPILSFYGLVHLIKAAILTVDPNYPETTSVLAHGVSARKRKKQQYSFFNDEVKLQKSGLFPFMAEKMFHMKHLEGEKTIMEDLLKQVPEMEGLFRQMEGGAHFVQIPKQEEHFIIPPSIIKHYHMSEARFIEFLSTKSFSPLIKAEDPNFSGFHYSQEHIPDYKPIRFDHFQRTYHFPISKNTLSSFPELLIHYLLLYNLSMIARYETEWWSELIKMMPNNDYPFIKTFLHITSTKGPYLVNQYLQSWT